jgi:regulator of replication initiation timing
MEKALDPTTITAIGGFITGLAAVCVTVYTALNSASQTEVRDLRDRITKLEAENGALHRENTSLREYVGLLRTILREHGIDVPPMRAVEDEPK